MGQRPTIRQIKLYRSICRKLGVPADRCLRHQDEMDKGEMNEWIGMHHPKAKLMGLSEKSLAAGIRKVELETRKLKDQLL